MRVIHEIKKSWKRVKHRLSLRVNRRLTVARIQRLLRQSKSAAQLKDVGSRPGCLLYVAASTLPYHISGYTTRTQELVRTLQSIAPTTLALTRPGYPQDRRDRLTDALSNETIVETVRYHHLARPANVTPVFFYVARAACAIEQFARDHNVTAIHAASNHVNALPALIAARRLGIPFQYEMRGLWELTRVSRMPEFENSQAYRQGLELEGLVARNADKLFVISDQLGRYMVKNHGVLAERMELLPNCIDSERWTATVPTGETVVPKSIGYAGSLIGYEGLDTLVEAVHTLVARQQPVTVEIIGDGEARADLENQVRRLGLMNYIRFHGKLPPAEAREKLARCAVVCIPRKPYEVCQIVTPIKLVEALAMAKPVIVPDLPVFRDELGDDPAGWFFQSGDALDLARVLDHVLHDLSDEALLAIGKKGRAYAFEARNWRTFARRVSLIAEGDATIKC